MSEKPMRTYNGNPNIKGAGVRMEYTKEQILEYRKCSTDIVYFIETYCKVMTLDHGFTNIKLRDYQKRYFKFIDAGRFSVVSWPRQSAKSASSMLYILWKTLFTADQQWFILANKLETAREIFGRMVDAYESLPFWLQQGVLKLNESTIEMCNGSTITASASSKSSIRGRTASGIMWDEAAFVDNDEDFYTSTFPAISSGATSKFIMVSTPNGMNNVFYRTYSDAKRGAGRFRLMEIEWDEVPGRDNEWRKSMIETVGRRRFDQEFNCSFLGSEGTLIPLDIIERIELKTPLYEVDGVAIYEEPIEGHTYFITVDTSRGTGNDNSAFSVFDVTKLPYRQVATFYNNEISSLAYPHIVHELGIKYHYAYVLVEVNDAGVQVADILAHDLEYPSILWVGSNGRAGQKIGVQNQSRPGVMTSKAVKATGCATLRVMMEGSKLEIYDRHTFSEMTSFVAKGQSYEAENGSHDDLMMTLVLLAWAVDQPYFNDMLNQTNRTDLIAEKLAALENDMLPFGFFTDGKTHSERDPVVDYSDNFVRDEFSDWMAG